MENVHSYWHILLCDKSYCPFHSKAVSKNCWQRFCRWAVLSHSLSPRTDQAPRKPATRFVFFLKHRRFLKLFRLKKSNHFIMQWADLTYSGTNRDFNDNQDTVRSIPERSDQTRSPLRPLPFTHALPQTASPHTPNASAGNASNS